VCFINRCGDFAKRFAKIIIQNERQSAFHFFIKKERTMPQKYMIGNFKMNQTPAETIDYIAQFEKQDAIVNRASNKPIVVLCPPATNLFAANAAISNQSIHLGIQTVNQHQKGAHTGEIALSMAKACGVGFALVGHSERRSLYGETDQVVATKLAAILQEGVTPVLCIGETLAERESGKLEYVINEQLTSAFANLSGDQALQTIVAYEPVWAIGTGVSANPEQVAHAAQTVRSCIAAIFNQTVAAEVSVLYGGSLSLSNMHFLNIDGIDGGLVGGASLDPVAFSLLTHF